MFASTMSRRSVVKGVSASMVSAVLPSGLLRLAAPAEVVAPRLLAPVSLDREVLWYASRCYCCGSEHYILAPRGRHPDGTPFMYICEFCKWHVSYPHRVLPMPDDFQPDTGWKLWPLLCRLNGAGLLDSAAQG